MRTYVYCIGDTTDHSDGNDPNIDLYDENRYPLDQHQH